MSLSELIEALQAAHAKHGDLPVYVDNGVKPQWLTAASIQPGTHSWGREWVQAIEVVVR